MGGLASRHRCGAACGHRAHSAPLSAVRDMLRHFARALPLASVRPAVARPWQWGSRGAFSTSQEEGFQLHYPRNAAEGAAATEATEEQTDEFPDEFTDDRLNKARREDAMQESTEDEVFAEDLARVSRRPPDPFAVSDISEEDMLVVEAKLICDEPRADSSMLGFVRAICARARARARDALRIALLC